MNKFTQFYKEEVFEKPKKLEDCVREVMYSGKSKDSAWAICQASVMGKSSSEVKEELEGAEHYQDIADTYSEMASDEREHAKLLQGMGKSQLDTLADKAEEAETNKEKNQIKNKLKQAQIKSQKAEINARKTMEKHVLSPMEARRIVESGKSEMQIINALMEGGFSNSNVIRFMEQSGFYKKSFKEVWKNITINKAEDYKTLMKVVEMIKNGKSEETIIEELSGDMQRAAAKSLYIKAKHLIATFK